MNVSNCRMRLCGWGQKKEFCLVVSFIAALFLLTSNTRLTSSVIKEFHSTRNCEKANEEKAAVQNQLITLSFMLNKLQVLVYIHTATIVRECYKDYDGSLRDVGKFNERYFQTA